MEECSHKLIWQLNPDWGNTVNRIVSVHVPKGTIYYEGFAAPQSINRGLGVLLGGGNQIYTPRGGFNLLWFTK